MLYALQITHAPYSKNQCSSQLQHRHTFFVFEFSHLRLETENYREFDTAIVSTQHTCYTKDIPAVFGYMLYKLHTNHTRQVKLRHNSNTGTRFSFLNFRVLDLRRRTIARSTPPSWAHSILATQKIYQLCSKIHIALKTQTCPCTALVFFETNQVDLRRRAIANCTPTSWAHCIHATQKIYHPCSKIHTALKPPTCPSTFLVSLTKTKTEVLHLRNMYDQKKTTMCLDKEIIIQSKSYWRRIS